MNISIAETQVEHARVFVQSPKARQLTVQKLFREYAIDIMLYSCKIQISNMYVEDDTIMKNIRFSVEGMRDVFAVSGTTRFNIRPRAHASDWESRQERRVGHARLDLFRYCLRHDAA